MPRFDIGPFVFPSKAQAREYCSRLLNEYALGVAVSADDFRFLHHLLERHGGAEQKIGCGVSSFEVQPDDFGHRCFWLTRVDGSRTYFSYRWCLDQAPNDLQRARFAFRHEIQDQIIAFKKEMFAQRSVAICAVSGRLLHWPEANVDHEPPLHALRDAFLLSAGLNLLDVAVQPWVEGEHRYLFTDRSLAARWSRYHAEHARLRIVLAEENARKGAG